MVLQALVWKCESGYEGGACPKTHTNAALIRISPTRG